MEAGRQEKTWRAIVYYEEDVPPNTEDDFKKYDDIWIHYYVCSGSKLAENASLSFAERVPDRAEFKRQVRQARLEARKNSAIRFIESSLRFRREQVNPNFLDLPPELRERVVNLSLDRLEELSIDVLWIQSFDELEVYLENLEDDDTPVEKK